MNKNLDGTDLSREQLMELALRAGMSPEKCTRDVKTWVFRFESRHLRHEMFMRGELLLDTSGEHVPGPLPTVDPEVVAFFEGVKS